MTGLCRSGKAAYPDEPTAVAALGDIRDQNAQANNGRRTPRRAYQCHWCSDWHLTSRKEGR